MFVDTESREFEGITVEEAIDKAEKALGVSREILDIKVVCEEKRGLFGMQGAKPAKIKVIKKIK
jgi:predicted RNA-binding protein Jag